MLSAWAHNNGLKLFNPSKTEFVLFTRKYNIPNLKLPKLLGETLTLSSSEKYLGITLDKKLDWMLNTVGK